MFSAYKQEDNLSFIMFNLFYLRFCFRSDVCTGNIGFQNLWSCALLHTHTHTLNNTTFSKFH